MDCRYRRHGVSGSRRSIWRINRTFAPSILDNSQSLVAFGLGWRNGPNAVDLGAAVGIFGGRTVRNNQNPYYNGDYDFSATIVSLTYTRNF